MFEGQKCMLLSMRDVTSSHILDKTKQEIDMLKKFSQTISKDLVDPLSLIDSSANWLIWQHKENKEHFNSSHLAYLVNTTSLFS